MRHLRGEPGAEGGARRDRRRPFSPDEPGRYRGLVDSLLWGGDHYLLLADYDDLRRDAGARRRAVPPARAAGPTRAIANVAGMGAFSSDRTIREYATQIWGIDAEPR